MASEGHIETIDGLRALAALSVCLYHVSGFFKADLFLRSLTTPASYGSIGVQIFFVISGFVIPYALLRSKYTPARFGRFLVKRVTRLDPPYFATIILVLGYYTAASRTSLHEGPPFVISWAQVAAHVGYVNAFVGLPWLMDSFWTLAIEFQYYVLIGLLFPLVARRGWPTTILLTTLCCLMSWLLPWNQHLPHHLPLFAMGITIFRRLSVGISATETAVSLGIATIGGVVLLGLPGTVSGIATALALLFLRYSNRILAFLGDISYSLYLIHPLVAGIVVLQGRKFLGQGRAAELFLLTASFSFCILCGFLLYVSVERWSRRLSARIRYQPAAGLNPEPRSLSFNA